jgi:NAD(P)-dependent dehydrogenase (short-subunit alcohol dehydrogenase family)
MSSTNTRRVALVTGAAQGIGLAIALRLAADGLDIALNDIALKSELLEEGARVVEARGGRALVVHADVCIEGEVREMVDRTVQAFGRLDVVSFAHAMSLLVSYQGGFKDGGKRWHWWIFQRRGWCVAYTPSSAQLLT